MKLMDVLGRVLPIAKSARYLELGIEWFMKLTLAAEYGEANHELISIRNAGVRHH